MSSKWLLTQGLGLSPGSIKYLLSLGLSLKEIETLDTHKHQPYGSKTVSGTSKVGYNPKIEQPVRDIEFDIDLDDIRTSDRVGEMTDQDREGIAEYLQEYQSAKEALDQFDRQLDEILKDLSIPYNPEDYPDLHTAQPGKKSTRRSIRC